MQLPVIQGVIDRRLLVNYRVDADALARFLPEPFEPKLQHGCGVAGICLIRLKAIRPRGLPRWLGVRSENAAHRIAIEWQQGGQRHEGVYIVRRDTSAWINTVAGGRLFPGIHHHAHFHVDEFGERYALNMQSNDGAANVEIIGHRSAALPEHSIFATITEASDFFQRGSIGYSPNRSPGQYDGIELRTKDWGVEPIDVEHVYSSFFEGRRDWPNGSAQLDHALLMRQIEHEWHDQGVMRKRSQQGRGR